MAVTVKVTLGDIEKRWYGKQVEIWEFALELNVSDAVLPSFASRVVKHRFKDVDHLHQGLQKEGFQPPKDILEKGLIWRPCNNQRMVQLVEYFKHLFEDKEARKSFLLKAFFHPDPETFEQALKKAPVDAALQQEHQEHPDFLLWIQLHLESLTIHDHLQKCLQLQRERLALAEARHQEDDQTVKTWRQEAEAHRGRQAALLDRQKKRQGGEAREERRQLERERLEAQRKHTQLLLFPETQVIDPLVPSAFKVLRDTGRAAQEEDFRRLHAEFTKDADTCSALRQHFVSYMEHHAPRQQLLHDQLNECRQPMARADCERFCMSADFMWQGQRGVLAQLRADVDALAEQELASCAREGSQIKEASEAAESWLTTLQTDLEEYCSEHQAWEEIFAMLKDEAEATTAELQEAARKVAEIYKPLVEYTAIGEEYKGELNSAEENSKKRVALYDAFLTVENVSQSCRHGEDASQKRCAELEQQLMKASSACQTQEASPAILRAAESVPQHLAKGLKAADQEMQNLSKKSKADTEALRTAKAQLVYDQGRLQAAPELWKKATTPSEWQVQKPIGTDALQGLSCPGAATFWQQLQRDAQEAEPLRQASERRWAQLVQNLQEEGARQEVKGKEVSQIAALSQSFVKQMDGERQKMQQLEQVKRRHEEVREMRVKAFKQEIDKGLTWLAQHTKSLAEAKRTRDGAQRRLRDGESGLNNLQHSLNQFSGSNHPSSPFVSTQGSKQDQLHEWKRLKEDYEKASKRGRDKASEAARFGQQCQQRYTEAMEVLQRLQNDSCRLRDDLSRLREGRSQWPLELFYGLRVESDELTSSALKQQEKLRKELGQRDEEFASWLQQLQQLEASLRQQMSSEQQLQKQAAEQERSWRQTGQKNEDYETMCKQKMEELEEAMKKEEWEEQMQRRIAEDQFQEERQRQDKGYAKGKGKGD